MLNNPRLGIIRPGMVTVALELPRHRIISNIGIARGIVVRSRSIVGNFIGGIHSIFGGNITVYTELCEQARAEAYDLMLRDAVGMGANAVIGLRYDATEVMAGITEVLCYGSAVLVEDTDPSAR